MLDYYTGTLVKELTYKGQYNTYCTLTDTDISRGHYYVQVISCYEGLLTDGEKREVIIDDQNNPVTGVKLGDADGDDALTILDATAIQRTLAKLSTKKFDKEAADADQDGTVTILDATAIQRHLAKLNTNKNIGKPMS